MTLDSRFHGNDSGQMAGCGRIKKAPSEDEALISRTVKPTAKGLTNHPSALTVRCLRSGRHKKVLVIPRKEVIQPQVPLRLPCYDLVPVIGRTVGSRVPIH